LIKNFDPTWVFMEISPTPAVSPSQYAEMETFFSGLNFHLYLIDYDLDGHLDIVYVN
jgi:hypothetical protein